MRITRTLGLSVAALAVSVALVGGLTACSGPDTSEPKAVHTRSATPTKSAAPYTAPTADAIAALPEARYDAVVPGLLAFRAKTVPAAMDAVDTIAADAPLYASDRTTPVARLAAKNFLGQDTVVVPVRVDGPWSLVLTPARRALPSKDPSAPAQTSAWIRSDLLHRAQQLSDHIVVDVKAQTVSIVDSSGSVKQKFSAGVGANGTPTPTGIGYMEARYLDPAQDQTVYPIGLTSLHSSAADEPFGGSDGGLIGIHYEPTHSGAVSHGCVRLDGPSIAALNQLPLGTPVVMES
jgi:lipoprotein-anchoring transpeptidase ErfK/SrfK